MRINMGALVPSTCAAISKFEFGGSNTKFAMGIRRHLPEDEHIFFGFHF